MATGAQKARSTMPHNLPRHVKRVTAKGKVYYYFDTGLSAPDRNGNLQKVFVRLPDVRAADFGDKLAAAQAARTKRNNARMMMTVERMATLYQDSREWRALASNTQDLYTIYLREVVKLIGNAPAHDVRPSDVETMLDRMGNRPGAANASLRVLGALYAWGRKRSHVRGDVNPTGGIKDIPAGEHKAWPEHVLQDALQAADQRVRLATHLMLYTGQRIGDVMAMRWSDIRDGVIHVRQQKTGKELYIPLHSALAAELQRTPRKGMTIITNRLGQPMTDQTIRRYVKAHGRKHGLQIVPHGLRKNAVIALLESGCSVAETAAITGQTYGMVEHYARQINQARMASAAIIKWQGVKS